MCDQDDSHFTDTPSSANSENGNFLTYLEVVLDAIGKAFKATRFVNRSISGLDPCRWYDFHDACDAANIVQSHREIIIKNHKGKNDGLDTWGNDLKCLGQFIIECHQKYGRDHAEDKSNRSKTE
ncbi:hypothetical protein [Gimesia aquarii]|uniref:Uncharacterized protein n=1 Tax=Gimesia aquarii TaxID=2527964 RepID=A0A517VTE7_9PLAN|nr:hypothetical protein [Gimesia aquarii]QDT96250.1 hypothetical protein V144x_17040 [Gimesia aquarii]